MIEPSGGDCEGPSTRYRNNESADTLAHELSVLLDHLIPNCVTIWLYSILTVGFTVAICSTMTTLQSAHRRVARQSENGIGEKDTNTVLKRSFSALMLSSMANAN